MYLSGEWVPAWLGMSVTFLVGALGVAGLGWWVLRGAFRNEAASRTIENPPEAEHREAHH